MRLIVLSPLLYHANCGNGGGLICYRLLKALAARHQVVFIAMSNVDAAEELAARADLQSFCAEVHVIRWRPAGRLVQLRWRVMQWLGGSPVEARPFDMPRVHLTLREAAARLKPQLLMLQFPFMAQYGADLPEVPTIMDVQDVFFVSRLREYAAQHAALPRLKRLVSWLAWTRYEMRWYRRCQAVMALTDPDRAALHALVPEVPSFTVPAAMSFPVTCPPHLALAHRVGFGGSFGHPPNLDALLWLSREIAPRLERLHPGVEIVVAGRGVPDEVRAELHPCVRLEGFVHDYPLFLGSCTVFLAPLRFGGGVKIKVLDALGCGRPVVTTAIGAEGIDIRAEEGLQVAHTADELARLAAAILADPAAAFAAAARGASKVARMYSVDAAVARFEEGVAPWLAPTATDARPAAVS